MSESDTKPEKLRELMIWFDPDWKKYPALECSEHDADAEEPYMVCTHVMNGTDAPFRVVLSSKNRPGEVECHRAGKHEMQDLLLVCACCCREKGWLVVPIRETVH